MAPESPVDVWFMIHGDIMTRWSDMGNTPLVSERCNSLYQRRIVSSYGKLLHGKALRCPTSSVMGSRGVLLHLRVQ